MTAGSRVLRRAFATAAALALTVSSCGREPTGPEGPNGTRVSQPIAFAPQFPAAYASYVQALAATNLASVQAVGGLANQVTGDAAAFTKVRVVLRNPDGSIALDMLVDFPAGATEVPVTLTVPLPASTPAGGVPLALTLNYQNAAGETVFTGGPVSVNAIPSTPGSGPPPPSTVTIPLTYTGVGSTAAGVRITPKALTVNTGGTFSVSAVAVDAGGTVIPNTPIVFVAEDGVKAQVNAVTGAGTAGSTRGVTRIVAQLLTHQEDAATLTIRATPTTLALVSGSDQTANVGANLANPVIVRVTAADGGGVDGVTVNFAAQNGGSVGTASAVTDANGNAQTTWRLGSTAGAQTLTATAAGLTGSPLTVNATGRALDPVRLAFGQQPPPSVNAGDALLPPITVRAVDASGTVATSFTGPVTLALGAGAPAGGALFGTTTANAVAGVATFSDLRVTVPGTYTLVASNSSLTGATSTSFTVVAGTANRLAFQNYPVIGGVAGATLDPVTVVVRDAFNNPVTSFTGAVTIVANGPTAIASTTEGAPANSTTTNAAEPSGTTPANALLGTTTVNAVAGVATFSDLRLTSSGGYTLSASATGLVTGTGPSFGIVAGPASLLSLVSGGGQSTPGASPFPNPIVVRVTDAFGNGVGGVSVTFTPVATTGNANPASATSDPAGFAQTIWTPIGTAGAKTLNVTGPGLTPNPLAVTGTSTSSSGTLRTWTGVTSVFNEATNWTPAGVPGAADILTVPSIGNWPINSANITVGALTVDPAVQFTNNATLTVAGTVSVPGGLNGSGNVVLTGSGTWSGLIQQAMTISGGIYALTGEMVFVDGDFTISASGKVTTGNNGLVVSGNFQTTSGGRLDMQDPGALVSVMGNATFAGGSTQGMLTGGLFGVMGNFTTSGTAFSASGTHSLFLSGETGTQTLTFTSPVAGQGINNLVFEQAAAKVISGSPNILGSVTLDFSTAPVTGPGATVSIGGGLFDGTDFVEDTQGGWRVDNTKITGTSVIDAAFITTNLTVATGTLSLVPDFCSECELREAGLRASLRSLAPRARMERLRAAGARVAQLRQAYARSSTQARSLANYTGGGYLQVNGSVLVSGASAVLDINGASMDISADFGTALGGRLDMTDEYGQLTIMGNASFAGGSTAGMLTNGQMTVLGDFMQGGGAANAFAASPDFYTYIGIYCYYCEGGGLRASGARAGLRAPAGVQPRPEASRPRLTQRQEIARALRAQKTKAHRDELAARMKQLDRRTAAFARKKVTPPPRLRTQRGAIKGNASVVVANSAMPVTIGFANPGSSTFGHLYIEGQEVNLASDIDVSGRLESGGGSYHTITSAAQHTITSRGSNLRDVTFDNTRWVVLDGYEMYDMEYVTFTNMSATVDQFTINRNGNDLDEGDGYQLYSWQFTVTPTTGRYINVTDSNGPGSGGSGTAAVEMIYPSPSTHGGHIITVNGGQILNWAVSFLWAGTVSSDWNNGSNWSTGFTPYNDDDVTIPAGTPFQPVIYFTYGYVRSLTIPTGASLMLDNGQIYVYGNLDAHASGVAVTCSGYGGTLYLVGSGGPHMARGRVCDASVSSSGNYQIGSGNILIVESSLYIQNSGQLALGGGTLDVGGPGGTGSGYFYTYDAGVLVMNNAADVMRVGTGGAYFRGGSTTGLLTNGQIHILGGCIHTDASSSSPSAFAASGAHKVIFSGTSNVEFYDPAQSFLNDASVVAGSQLELYTSVTVKGTLGRQGTGATSVVSYIANVTLTTSNLNFSAAANTVFSKVLINLVDGVAFSNFANITFMNTADASGGALLTVNRTGSPLFFSAITFDGFGVFAATSTEHYLSQAGAANVTISGGSPATGTLGTHYIRPGTGTVSW